MEEIQWIIFQKSDYPHIQSDSTFWITFKTCQYSGNPGPAEFYEPFMESLYKSVSVEKDGLTMCAISHAGHDTRHKKWLPTG